MAQIQNCQVLLRGLFEACFENEVDGDAYVLRRGGVEQEAGEQPSSCRDLHSSVSFLPGIPELIMLWRMTLNS